MTILKQSPSKNLRSNGFKVKHFLQLCLLLAICFWLIQRVKNLYDGKKAYEEGAATQSEVQNELEGIQLGRKNISFPIQTTLGRERHEENKPEESKKEGRGGGDDEMEGSNGDKSEEEEPEEVEDLIDEEDREREDETAKQESQEAESRFEDENLVGRPGTIWRQKWLESKNAAGR